MLFLVNKALFLPARQVLLTNPQKSYYQTGSFRDCNGISNGKSLSFATLQQEEEEAGTSVGRAARVMGLKLKLR